MDRHAIFIDVGYVLASVADMVAGTPDRSRVRCDFGKLVEALVADVAKGTTLPLLRTYWYDASLTGEPQYDQEAVADLEGVRLRLGRLVRGEQKGVDSRIVRDLIVLARDRAIAEAHLLAGDADLCEGVQEAQDQGVRVVLIGVPGENQSRLLRQQVDQHRELPEAFWRSHFSLVEERAAAARTAAAVAAATRLEPAAVTRPAPVARPNPAMQEAIAVAVARDDSGPIAKLMGSIKAETDAYEKSAADAGADFARKLLGEASPPEIERWLELTGWQVPTDLDRQLLRYVDDVLGGILWERSELKPTVRQAFWDEFRQSARRTAQAT